MTALLEAALIYADRGWPVFPCKPGGKVPSTRHGFHDATVDLGRIYKFWSAHPDHNIGVATGVGFDCFDIDDASELDPAILRAFVDGDGPVVVTQGAGLHVYGEVTGLGNRTRFMPGSDWRGRGGYCIAPPSRGPKGQWCWLDGCDETRPILPWPVWMIEKLNPAPVPARPAVVPIRPKDGYARAAIQGELDAILRAGEGTRNATLNTSAMKIGSLVGAGLLNEATAATMLTQAGVAVGLGHAESEATVRSGLRAGIASPRVVST